MTIQEAHTLWGRKADHILTYNKTKEVFEHGFKILDLSKATSFYSKKDLATALAYSDLPDAQKPIAASVMCHILNFAHETMPNQQAAINFTHYELLNYKPVAPATDPAEPTSVLAYNNVNINVNVNDNVNQFSKTEKLTNSKTQKPINSKTEKLTNSKTEKLTNSKTEKLTNSKTQKPINSKTEKLTNSKTEKPTNSKTEKNKTNMNKEKSVCDSKPKAVRQIDQETGKVICNYVSISEAERRSKVKNIRRAIERNGTAGGYVWEYVNGNVNVNVNVNDNNKPSAIRHQTSLADLSDQELIDEMKRRGWKGNVEIVVKVTLG